MRSDFVRNYRLQPHINNSRASIAFNNSLLKKHAGKLSKYGRVQAVMNKLHREFEEVISEIVLGRLLDGANDSQFLLYSAIKKGEIINPAPFTNISFIL
jgi:hypothetical protein